MIFTIIMLPVVGTAVVWLCFYAPKMPTPQTGIIHVSRFKEPKEIKTPWYVTGLIISAIILCQLYWQLGVIVIIAGLMFMAYMGLKDWAIITRRRLRVKQLEERLLKWEQYSNNQKTHYQE